jgi:hypothetical protein
MIHQNDFQIATRPVSTTKPGPAGHIAFIATVMSLNVLMVAILLNRGFDFWPNNPEGADSMTTIACAIVSGLTVAWAVIYAKRI